MGIERKPLPKELIATRPVIAEDPNAEHPSQGPMMGPPPRAYNNAVHEFIVRKIKGGARPKIAAAEAGIPYATYTRWLKMGKEGHPHLWKFANEVEQAMAIAENRALNGVIGDLNDPENAPSADDLKWYLERTRPDGYDKNVDARVRAELEGFVNRLEANLPPQVYEMVVRASAGELVTMPEDLLLTNGSIEEDVIE